MDRAAVERAVVIAALLAGVLVMWCQPARLDGVQGGDIGRAVKTGQYE